MRKGFELTMLTMAALIATAPVCHALSPREARAEILPVEDKDLAKIAVQETKTRMQQYQMDDGTDGSDDTPNIDPNAQCGTVSIGNNTTTTNNNAVNSIVPSTTTVIVTGNVYNTASCGH
jgi:hypothetical protein